MSNGVAAGAPIPFTRKDFETAAREIESRLQPNEELDDFLVGCAYLAAERAALLGREGNYEDLVFAMSIWTKWPYKPNPPKAVEKRLLAASPNLFKGLAQVDFHEWRSGHPFASSSASDPAP